MFGKYHDADKIKCHFFAQCLKMWKCVHIFHETYTCINSSLKTNLILVFTKPDVVHAVTSPKMKLQVKCHSEVKQVLCVN